MTVAALFTALNKESRTGMPDPTPQTPEEKKAVADVLSGLTGTFPQELARKSPRLSPKQWYWAIKLAGEAIAPPKPTVTLNFDAIVQLFVTAAKHLKFPKIRLGLDNQPVCLSRAGQKSRYTGTINITDGGPYGDNKWFGRIELDGKFTEGRLCTDDIVTLLKIFSANPAKVAAEHGRLTGNCCFCGRGLKDERSTDMGYGPVCATNFGLPWG